jgi:hypothetical protein
MPVTAPDTEVRPGEPDTSHRSPPRDDRDDLSLRALPFVGLALVVGIASVLDHWIVKATCADQCAPVQPGVGLGNWVLVPALQYSGAMLVYSLLGVGLVALSVRELHRSARFNVRDLAALLSAVALIAAVSYAHAHVGEGASWPLWLTLAAAAAILVFMVSQARAWLRREPPPQPRSSAPAAVLFWLVVVMIVVSGSPLFTDAVLRHEMLDQTVYSWRSGAADPLLWSTWLAAGLAALVIACQAVLATALRRPGIELPAGAQAEELRSLSHTVRTLLIGSSVFLVLGVVQVHTIYDWAFQLTGLAQPPNAAEILAALTVVSGVFYSMILIAIFAPPLLLLRRWTRALAAEQLRLARGQLAAQPPGAAASADAVARGSMPGDIERWLEENHLTVGWPRTTVTVLGMLAPFLAAGPGAAILSALT